MSCESEVTLYGPNDEYRARCSREDNHEGAHVALVWWHE